MIIGLLIIGYTMFFLGSLALCESIWKGNGQRRKLGLVVSLIGLTLVIIACIKVI